MSSNFQCCAFVDILNGYSKRGHTDEYSVKLHYQQLVLSEIMNQEDARRASQLGVMQESLKD